MNFEQPPTTKTLAQKIQDQINQTLEHLYLELQTDPSSINKTIEGISRILAHPTIAAELPNITPQTFATETQKCATMTDKKQFIECMTTALKPIITLKLTKTKLFEDIEAQAWIETAGFIPLNERISYGKHRDSVHLHLAPSYSVKENLPELFIDAMKKLAQIIESDESIKSVTGTSWVLATRTFGSMLESFGFQIQDVPEDIKAEHFSTENRPIKMMIINREDFLKRFS